jgi:Carboxypeptidase regulatory-like domain
MKAVGILIPLCALAFVPATAGVLLGLQGIPIAPQAGGTVTGVLRNAEGKPAAGVRVAAMTRPDSGLDAGAGTSLASITQTDEAGHYRLESIPSGQYYIVAGRVDRPTFYPGAQQIAAGTVLQITPGAVVSGIDFAMDNSSVRTPITDVFGSAMLSTTVQVRVVTEDGSKLPISSSAGLVTLQFKRKADGATTLSPITTRTVPLVTGLAANSEYQVSVEHLPAGYAVKSIFQGAVDITAGVLTIPSAAPAGLATTLASTLGFALVVPTGGASPPTTATVFAALGAQLMGDPVTVTLAVPRQAASTTGSGVRVTGLGRPSDTHPVYISGKQGTVYSDGTFEFLDVPPGRHTIATIDYPGRALGATIIVGDREIRDVSLDDVSALPTDIQTPADPGPTEGAAPGAKVPFASIRGRVVEEITQLPPPSGQVFISSRYGPSYPLDGDGRFEIPNLLPGVYKVEIRVAGHSNIIREVRLGTSDVTLEVTSRRQD